MFTSRTIRQLSLTTATLTPLLACSPAPSGPSTDLGVFEVDGPVQIDVTFDAIPYRSTRCAAMSPSVSLSWTGEEAQVALDVSLRNTYYQEDALATDGEVIPDLTGRGDCFPANKMRPNECLPMYSGVADGESIATMRREIVLLHPTSRRARSNSLAVGTYSPPAESLAFAL